MNQSPFLKTFEVRYSVGDSSRGYYETSTANYFHTVVTAANSTLAESQVRAQNGGSGRCQIDWVRPL